MNKIKKIFYLLSGKEKKNFIFVLFLIFIMAMLDTLGVVSILPFIAIISNPNLVETNNVLSYFYETSGLFGVKSIDQFLFFLGFIVFFLLIFSITIRAFTNYFQVNFALMLEYTFSKRLIESYLHQPYIWFLNRNSSELGKNILSEVNLVVNGTMVPMMNLITQSMVTIAILSMLFIVDKILTIVVGSVLIISYLIVFYFIKSFLDRLGTERFKVNERRFSIVTEAFGALKETKFSGLEKRYIKNYSNPAKIYARNISLATAIAQVPRNFIEGIAFGGMIILVLYLMSNGEGFMQIVPLIALYAFAGYRLMPALQQIYSAITQLRFSGSALDNLFNDMKKLQNSKKIKNIETYLEFKKYIKLNNISFKYPRKDEESLKNISLSISYRSKVGIIGSTGSGKTTTADIILGLLNPINGNLQVDDKIISASNVRSWQKKIGYVPQQIYLSDSSIASNIAFGIEEKNINQLLIEKVSKIANLHEFVANELEEGYSTIVGERGVRLSGGQRQRIGIARALYNNPDLLVFDEATNSLDNVTEKLVMEAIDKLSDTMTIIVIAHRLSTIKNCDEIFLLDKGKLKAKGKFENILLNNQSFVINN